MKEIILNEAFYFNIFFDTFITLSVLPFFLSLITFIFPATKAHRIAVIGSTIIFWSSIFLLFFYYFLHKNFLIYNLNYDLLSIFSSTMYPFSLSFEFSIDSISLLFLFLTSFVFLISFFIVFDNFYHDLYSAKTFYILLFLMQFFIFLAFFTVSIFFFYVFFEAVLLPMYLIIVLWGARSRKIKAAYFFLMYTLFFSFLLLYGLLILYISIEYNFIYKDLFYLDDSFFFKDFYQENFLWLCFFFALAVKIPVFPLHLWLPEAHVEAPTVGSIILASILLKLGGYGFIRFLIPIFPNSTIFFRPLVIILCLCGTIYGAVIATIQLDLKKIVAYSSVSHMNFAILGLFSLNYDGILGATLLFLSHGLTSAALFFLVGIIYRRFGTRLLKYYGGLNNFMPMFVFFFLFFSFSNIGFPGTLNYVAEFLLFLGIINSPLNLFIFILTIVSFVGSVVYTIWNFNKISYGNCSQFLNFCYDINFFEFVILFLLLFFTLIFGIFTYYLSDFLLFDIFKISYIFKFY